MSSHATERRGVSAVVAGRRVALSVGARGGGARAEIAESGVHSEKVAPRVERFAGCLLGAPIAASTGAPGRARNTGAAAARFGDAEVRNFDFALPRNEDVLRAQVAVDDAERAHLLVAATVRVIEPLGH